MGAGSPRRWGRPTVEGRLEVLLVLVNLLEVHYGKLVVVGSCHSHSIALHPGEACGEDGEGSACPGWEEEAVPFSPAHLQGLLSQNSICVDGSAPLPGGPCPPPKPNPRARLIQNSPLILPRVNWPGRELGTKVLIQWSQRSSLWEGEMGE